MATLLAVGRTALQGVPVRWLLTQSWKSPALCRCLPLHVSPAASLCSSRTETPRSTHNTAGTHTHNTTGTNSGDKRTREEEEEEEDDGPEYIPSRKAKNPMMKVGYAWMIGLPTGIISFLLAKRAVDKNRLKQLKVRQRMRRSNEGDYKRDRYFTQAEDVKLGR